MAPVTTASDYDKIFVRGYFSMLLIHLNLPSDDFFFVDGDVKLPLVHTESHNND